MIPFFYTQETNFDGARQAVLIANGQFDSKNLNLENVKKAKVRIAVDAGLSHFDKLGISPTHFVGDRDSIKKELRNKYEHVPEVILARDKDETDLEYALRLIDWNLVDRVTALGALGGHSDHMLRNLYLLTRYPEKMVIESPQEWTFAIRQTRIKTSPGQKISLYPIAEPSIITSKGLKWELRSYSLNSEKVSQSNEAVGDLVELSLQKGKAIVIVNT